MNINRSGLNVQSGIIDGNGSPRKANDNGVGVGGGVIVSGSVSPLHVENPVINMKYSKPEMAEVGVKHMDPMVLIPSRGSPL